jgi:hypothetical protein
LRGGNVIELARFVWDYEKHEVAMAAAGLLHEFGHPIPERPHRGAGYVALYGAVLGCFQQRGRWVTRTWRLVLLHLEPASTR